MPDDHAPADVRLLARRLRPERRNLVALTLVLVVAMALPLAGPILMGHFVDAALDGEPTSTLVAIALAFLATALAGDGLQLLVTWLSVRLAWRVSNSLRMDLCRHALGLDLAWHGEHSAGQLIERIDGDVDALTRFASTAILQLFGNALMLVGVLIISTIIDWRAGLLIALSAGVAVGLLVHFRRVATPYYDDEREVQGQLYGDLEERLDGLEDLRANGAGRWAVQRLQENSARWWSASRRAGLRGGGAMAAASLTFTAGSVLMLALGVYLNRQGEMTVGTVLTLFRFSQQVSDPLWQVAEQLSEFQKAAAGTRRAARLLATETTIADGRAGDLPAGPLALDLDEVSFGYGTAQPVLHSIDLHLAPGTSLGIVGRTGSGKSSVGRLALRLWDPEVGKVRLGGKDLRDVRFEDLRRRTAVVTQEVEIFRASLRDNLTLFGAIVASDDDLRAALDDVGLDVWWRSLPRGIDSDLHGPDDLSAGEAQLLAFARVLLTDPGLVVLDEASSRLDPDTEQRLKAATTRLLEGRTAVIIAHRLATLDDVDEILVLDHGHIVEHGARDVLATDTDSRYAQLTQASLAAGGTR